MASQSGHVPTHAQGNTAMEQTGSVSFPLSLAAANSDPRSAGHSHGRQQANGIISFLFACHHHLILLNLPTLYARRIRSLARRVDSDDIARDPPSNGGAWAVIEVRTAWQTFYKSLLREWVLTAGTSAGICALGGTILQTSSVTEIPVINTIGVIAVVVAFDGLVMSLSHIRYLSNIDVDSLDSVRQFVADLSRLQHPQAPFLTVCALLAGPAACLVWSIILAFTVFLLTYGWSVTQAKSLGQFVPNNTFGGSSGNTSASAADTSRITSTQLGTSYAIVVGVSIVLVISHFIMTARYFSRLCIPETHSAFPLRDFGGNAAAPDVTPDAYGADIERASAGAFPPLINDDQPVRGIGNAGNIPTGATFAY